MAASTTFYSEQSANRRNSILLVLLVCLFLGVLGGAIGYALTGSRAGAIAAIVIAVVVGGLSAIGSYFVGDKLVLAASSAKPVSEEQAPQLYNVIRELTIAAGIPMPAVYIIQDNAMNAFATGRDPQHSSVAITTGLLNVMNREELQGVLGHELSHVRNFDIRFSLLVGVLVGGVALLSSFFLRYTFWFGGGRRSNNNDNGGGGALQLIVFVIAIILAILAPIFTRLVQLAVSRQREYLADASSVELTRNPHGLESALAKLAGDTTVMKEANPATQHLYFHNPLMKLGASESGLFSTHPPLVARINRLRQLTGEAPLPPSEASSIGAAS
ncbi:MAG TPA: M48 family metallopeptidase [Candidatus Limnocylindrales bacterium]|nr:M48 family metallopeptidase [Candidatus Limnocylindrales bacterium]